MVSGGDYRWEYQDMALLKDCIGEFIDAILDEVRKRNELGVLSGVARSCTLGVLLFAISVILLLSANVALLTMVMRKI